MGKTNKRKTANQTQKTIKLVFACILALVLSFFTFTMIAEQQGWGNVPTFTEVKTFLGLSPKVMESDCAVHFIDVGQGDSILIQSDGKNILIDAGENNQGTTVVRYLKNQKVTTIDLLIGTHPHSDHIGGMDTVIDNFEIKQIIMPKLSDDLVPTTQTYTDVLKAIQQKQLKITPAKVGNSYLFGKGVLTIVGPNEPYEDLNNSSVVAHFVYDKEESFLFTGDMEKDSEAVLLEKNLDIQADVLKAGHHGSKTSTDEAFLDKVNPEYVVISVGQDNRYNHPHNVTLDKFKKNQISVSRTDYDGSVVFYLVNGKLTIQTEK